MSVGVKCLSFVWLNFANCGVIKFYSYLDFKYYKVKQKERKQSNLRCTHTVVHDIWWANLPLKSYVGYIWWGGLLQYVNYTVERCCNVGELEHSPELINTQHSVCVVLANQKTPPKNSETAAFSVDTVWNIICNITCRQFPSENDCCMWGCQSWALLFTAVESELLWK